MIKQQSAKITQGVGVTDTTLNFSSNNIIITSVIVGSNANGIADFIASAASGTPTLFRVAPNSDVSTGTVSPLFPVFLLSNELLIRTTFVAASVINVVVNYIEASADNPLFDPYNYFSRGYVSSSTAGDAELISNSESFNLNIKTINVTSDADPNEIILLLESPLFTPRIPISNDFTGATQYQLLQAPLILEPGHKLYIRQSAGDQVTAYASVTRLKP